MESCLSTVRGLVANQRQGKTYKGSNPTPSANLITAEHPGKEIMREYATREDAERDENLDLKIIYTCDRCHNDREDYPNCNVGGKCECGGTWQKTGESYSA